MGMPNKKLKKLMLTTGIALGVYAGFRWLLPLVIPFFIALGLAGLLRPPARWLQSKLTFVWGRSRRTIKPPLGLTGGVLLLVFGLAGIGLLYLGGRKVLEESRLLLENFPGLLEEADVLLTGWCGKIETAFHLEAGCAVRMARSLLRELGSYAASRLMPYVMGNSVAWLKAVFRIAVFVIVVFFGTVFALQESDGIRRYFRRSVFRQEYAEMGRILKVVGLAYGKTQLLILAGTIGICVAGLYLLGNPYYGLLGILIGILDALPFIGTGAVLVPWAVLCFFRGNGGQGLGLLALYGVCYLLRQTMESNMMGKEAGLSPFLTLAAVYVGIRLFGILGVALGPLGFLIIRESVDA